MQGEGFCAGFARRFEKIDSLGWERARVRGIQRANGIHIQWAFAAIKSPSS
jgi:hypothetical protein